LAVPSRLTSFPYLRVGCNFRSDLESSGAKPNKPGGLLCCPS